jgi:RNA polymerase sigma-70 factor (ECF subfamily)
MGQRSSELNGPASIRRSRFEELYRADRAAVAGYVLRRAGNVEDAADALAEVFVVAWRRLDQMPAGVESRLWLYGVARRVLANQRRGERRRHALSERLRAEARVEDYQPAPAADVKELALAFGRLPERDREVLALEAWEGLDCGEIATVLGCSRNAARIRLHRARRRLHEELTGSTATACPIVAVALPGEAA